MVNDVSVCKVGEEDWKEAEVQLNAAIATAIIGEKFVEMNNSS